MFNLNLLPPLPTTKPTHPQLENARNKIDITTGRPYLLITDTKDKIRTITLNRPKKKNAFNHWMFLALADAFNDAERDDNVLVVILSGDSCDYFTSGADLSPGDRTEGIVEALDDMATGPTAVFMRTMLRFSKPIVASVNGDAIGVGVTLLPHCDVVYAVDTAKLIAPFGRASLAPEFCSSYTLPKILGSSVANEMLLFNKSISSIRAKELGLVSDVFPKVGFMSRVMEEVRNALVYPLLNKTFPLFKNMIKRLEVDFLERLIIYELNIIQERKDKGEVAEAVLTFLQKQQEAKKAKKMDKQSSARL
jgi:peroxisomal 3,2-trans-enoyl-CoA isomerase